MFSIERRDEILALVNERNRVTVTELAKHFFIGEASIRRDLDKLGRSGLIKRTHGGAVRLETGNFEIPLVMRESESQSIKSRIAREASQFVTDGSVIILDSSSTVLKMVQFVNPSLTFTAITNGARTACDLSEHQHATIFSTGGTMRHHSLSYTGSTALRTIDGLVVDTMFFSCRAVSMEHGLMELDENECELRKAMIKSSRKRILLCDSSKFEHTSMHRICSWNSVDVLITDAPLSEEWLCFLETNNVQVIHAVT